MGFYLLRIGQFWFWVLKDMFLENLSILKYCYIFLCIFCDRDWISIQNITRFILVHMYSYVCNFFAHVCMRVHAPCERGHCLSKVSTREHPGGRRSTDRASQMSGLHATGILIIWNFQKILDWVVHFSSIYLEFMHIQATIRYEWEVREWKGANQHNLYWNPI